MRLLRLTLAVLLALPSLRRWPVQRVLWKQIYFSGIEAMPLLLFIAVAVGGIVVAQLHYQLGQSGEGSLRLLASISLSELSPLLTAIVLTARSSSAMASELALMRAHGELAALERSGVPLVDYLILPRVLGMTCAAVLTTFYFALATIVAGAVGVAGFNWFYEMSRLPDILSLKVLAWCLIKSLGFGAVMALVACSRGLSASGNAVEVPIAASSAVIRAMLALFALDLAFIVLGKMA